jgi:multiple sugar transport system permease protein
MERKVAALGMQPATTDKFAFVRRLSAWVGGLSIRSRLRWAGFLFVLPALIHLATFKFYPMLDASWLSFHRYDLMSSPVFNGLRNYQALWENPLFHQSFWVSAKYMFGVALPEWFLALGLALLLNRQIPGRSLIRLAYFFPIAMSQIVVAMVWKFMYHPHGLVNTILEFFWIGRINWLSTEETALPALIIIGIWRGIPLFAVLYLAGLQSIPKEYYEAAAIDGAGPLQRFLHITVPLLLPTILLVIVMSLLSAVKVFLNPLVMTEGGPNGTTRVLPYFIYETGFAYFRMGEAAAASMVLFAFVFVLTLINLRLLRRGGLE